MLVGGFCALETEPDEQFPVFMLIKRKKGVILATIGKETKYMSNYSFSN